MDRQQMEQYLKDTWKTGFNDGVESGNSADFRINLSKVLNETKGIGPKLFDRIMQNAKDVI